MMGDIEKQMRTALATGRGLALGAFLFLGVIGSLRAAEPPGVERLKRLGQWMAHYYERPEPNDLPRWMQEISASGGLEKASARYPVMVFVSEVARDHPANVGAWCEALLTLPPSHRAVFAWSFRNANAPQHERCQRGLPPDVVTSLRNAKPFLPLSRVPVTPGDLDMLWAAFMATGNEQPVNMIIDVLSRPLPERGASGSVEALLMNGAAKWSLASNAKQHPRVRLILEQRQAKASGLLRQQLDRLLANPETKSAGEKP